MKLKEKKSVFVQNNTPMDLCLFNSNVQMYI